MSILIPVRIGVSLLTSLGLSAFQAGNINPRTSSDRDATLAIHEASRYVSFRKPMLFQMTFSSSLVPSYGLQALGEIWTGKASNIPSVNVTISRKSSDSPLAVSNVRNPDCSPKKSTNLGWVVERAIQRMDEEGRLSLPVVIEAEATKTGYLVAFTKMPAGPGSDVFVELTKKGDIKEISQGH